MVIPREVFLMKQMISLSCFKMFVWGNFFFYSYFFFYSIFLILFSLSAIRLVNNDGTGDVSLGWSECLTFLCILGVPPFPIFFYKVFIILWILKSGYILSSVVLLYMYMFLWFSFFNFLLKKGRKPEIFFNKTRLYISVVNVLFILFIFFCYFNFSFFISIPLFFFVIVCIQIFLFIFLF